jgi:hypothetical protein
VANNSTDAAGFLDVRVASRMAGPISVSALSGSTILPTTAQFTAGNPNTERSTLVIAPNPIVAGDGGAQVWLRVADAYGNAVTGAAVTLTSSDGNDVFNNSGPTDAQGELSASVRSTYAGTKQVTATVLGQALQANLVVRANSDLPPTIGMTAGPNDIVADGTSLSTISIQVMDELEWLEYRNLVGHIAHLGQRGPSKRHAAQHPGRQPRGDRPNRGCKPKRGGAFEGGQPGWGAITVGYRAPRGPGRWAEHGSD